MRHLRGEPWAHARWSTPWVEPDPNRPLVWTTVGGDTIVGHYNHPLASRLRFMKELQWLAEMRHHEHE